jgi:hypothetical protein
VVALRSATSWRVAALLVGCAPEPETDDTLVAPGQVLAVRAEPAQAGPDMPVMLSALVAGPNGTVREAPLLWSFCSVRTALADNGSLAAACLVAPDVPDARGAEVELRVPKDACRLFGPDPPPSTSERSVPESPDDDAGDRTAGGAPAAEAAPATATAPPRPGRPTDPDFTGGYQQPIVLWTAPQSDPVVFGLRLTCGSPGATRSEAAELRRFGHANGSPNPGDLQAFVEGRGWRALPPEGDAAPLEVSPGARLALRLTWPACPAEGKDVCGDGICGPREDATGCASDCAAPHPCGGAERYVLLDPVRGDVRERREGLRLSWWSTGGAFEVPRTGASAVGEDGPRGAEPVTQSENAFTAPTSPGVYTLWVVIRDERGGTDWRSGRIQVGGGR